MATRQFMTFYMGSDFFGIDILYVREINRNMDMTPVDLAPDYVRGLLNLRGQIVTVLDLGVRLGTGRCEVTKSSSCIVLKTLTELERTNSTLTEYSGLRNELVGLLIDKVGDVVTVDDAIVEPPPAHMSGAHGRFIESVVKLSGALMIILKASEAISSGTEETKQLQAG